jgi:WD40 repeat protein
MNQMNSVEIDDAAEPFPSFTALRAAHTDLLQQDLQPDQADAVHLAEHFVKRAQATGKFLSDDTDRRSSQNILNYWASFLYRLDGVPRLVTLAKYDRNASARVGDVQCPYPGVRAFSEDESQFFFGRQRQIDYVLNRLKEDRLLVLVGPSGSGKTSLIRAGVLPALKRDAETSTRFFFPPSVPGSDPLLNLARMVQKARNAGAENEQWLKQQAEILQKDESHLLKLIEETDENPAVIFIDQGEDLYELGSIFVRLQDRLGLDPSAKVQTAFLGNLMNVALSQTRRHIVILVRRIGDFEPHFRRLPSRFKEVFEPARMVLPSLYPSELGEVIEKPADLLGVTFEGPALSTLKPVEQDDGSQPRETIVRRLVKQIASEPVGLPLLQFALTKLWDKRQQDKIPESALRELGTCREALVKTAESFYLSLDSRDQSRCRRFLYKLVTIGSDLRPHLASIHRSELYSSSRTQVAEDALLEKLSQAQLVRIQKGTTPSDDVVELVHELLLTAWPRMVGWIDSKQRVRRWSKIAATFLMIVLAGGIAFLGALWWGYRQEVEQSRELAATSTDKLINKRFDQALWLGQEAYKTNHNSETRINSLRLLQFTQSSTARPARFVRIDDVEVVDLALSSEKTGEPSQVAGIKPDGQILVWNLKTGALYRSFASERQPTYPLAFSPDNKKLATASDEVGVAVMLWDVESGIPEVLPQDGELGITAFAFSSDGGSLVTGDDGGNVAVWDLATKTRTLLYKHTGPQKAHYVSSIVFSEDGNSLASASLDGTVVLLNRKLAKVRPRTFTLGGELRRGAGDQRSDEIHSLAFNRSGNLLAGATTESVVVWDLSTGTTLKEFCPGSAKGLLLSFDPDSDSLAVWSYSGEISRWDIESGRESSTQLYKTNSPLSAAFGGHGRYLVLPSEGGLFLWEVYGSRPLTVDNRAVRSVAFSHNPGKQELVIGTDNGTLYAFDLEGEKKYTPRKTSKLDIGIEGLAFSGDDKVLGIAQNDGAINLVDANTLESVRRIDAWEALNEKIQPTSAGEVPVPASLSNLIFSSDANSEVFAVIAKSQPGDQKHKPGSRIILWDNKTNSRLASPQLDANFDVNALAISKDGKRLAAGGSIAADGKAVGNILMWQGTTPTSYQIQNATITSLAFDANEELLAVGTQEGSIFLCSGATGQQLNQVSMKAEGPVINLAFLAEGKLLAFEIYKPAETLSSLNKVVLWNIESPAPAWDFLENDTQAALNMTLSNGGTLASVRETNVVLRDLNVGKSGDRFCQIINCDRYLDPNNTLAPKKTILQKLFIGVSHWWQGD